MTETFFPIADMDEWFDFWRVNHEALTDDVGNEALCFELARNQSLMVGGGAGPLMRIGFVD